MKEGEGEVGRRNPNFPPRPPALRNKFNFVGGEGMSDDAVFTAAFFLSRILEFGSGGRGARTLPDGENRALNHDQSASKSDASTSAAVAA